MEWPPPPLACYDPPVPANTPTSIHLHKPAPPPHTQAFWVPSQTPASKEVLQKPDSSTHCPASGKKLRLKDCVAVKFTPVPENESGSRYMDPVTKDTFTNASRLVVIAPTGVCVWIVRCGCGCVGVGVSWRAAGVMGFGGCIHGRHSRHNTSTHVCAYQPPTTPLPTPLHTPKVTL